MPTDYPDQTFDEFNKRTADMATRMDESAQATGDGVTTMLRYNAGKLPFGLVPTTFSSVFLDYPDLPRGLLIETTKVLDFGAQKYSANNWRKGGPWVQVYNSLTRHLILGIMTGEVNDSDSGLNHWGHVGCNLAFLLEFAVHQIGTDDRYIRPDKSAYEFTNSNINSVDGLYGVMLEWLDGNETVGTLEQAIRIAAVLYEDTK